jgi:acetylornithine/succinyldiaminopimelate/putrescine aminotransferase
MGQWRDRTLFCQCRHRLRPALTCTDEEMDTIFDRVQLTLDQLLEQADIRAAIGK